MQIDETSKLEFKKLESITNHVNILDDNNNGPFKETINSFFTLFCEKEVEYNDMLNKIAQKLTKTVDESQLLDKEMESSIHE